MIIISLTVSYAFYFFYSHTKIDYQDDLALSIKGDLLELGYTLSKVLEQDEFSSSLNILYRSVVTHKTYASLTLQSKEQIVSTSKDLPLLLKKKSLHMDKLNGDALHDDVLVEHSFSYFTGSEKRTFILKADLDNIFLRQIENKQLERIQIIVLFFVALMIVLLSVFYITILRPLRAINENIDLNPMQIPEFKIREFSLLRNSFISKYKEVLKLNTELDSIVRQRTAKLEHINKIFNEAQELTHLGSWEWDIKNDKILWSDEIYRIFGLKPQAFAATFAAFLNMVHKDDRAMLQDAVQHTLETGEKYAVLHRIILPDGSQKIVKERGGIEKDSNNIAVRMVGTVHDVTEAEKNKTELLLQSEILKSLSDSVFVHELGGKFIYVNDRAYKSRGFTRDELMNMGVSELDSPYHTRPESQNKRIQNIKKQLDESGYAVFEVEHRIKNKGYMPVEIMSRRITIDKKDLFISIARDISERKRASEALIASEKLYKRLVENTSVGVFETDIAGGIFYVNQYLTDLMEYENQEELLRHKSVFFYKNPQEYNMLMSELRANNQVNNYEIEVITKKHHIKTLSLSASLHHNRLSGIIIDISEKKKDQTEIIKLSQALEQIDDTVAITNRAGTISYVNRSFSVHTGYEKEEIIGKNASVLKSGKHDKSFYKKMWSVILSGEVYRNQVINRKKDGEIYYEQKTITPVKDEDNKIIYFVSTGKDITDSIEMSQKLQLMATTDRLTGAYNRHRFEELFMDELARTKRYNRPLSLIMFDIDHFKMINDSYGHDVGDKVLRDISTLSKSEIRSHDIFARWGGEEFLILCPETNVENSCKLAEKLRFQIETYAFENIPKVTASFGVTQLRPEETIESILKRVDEALYQAKEKGRNKIESL
ncbi:diguanylate cyclase [bacterium]|nr:diguanylate cyclase [bacterium]MBU1990768.1 diguanylate cyclase [bacterium]